jgi:isoquinoline 1-oxidoreductase subunit alpha
MPRVELTVNGSRQGMDVEPGTSLLTLLRDDLDLTGAKYGCGEGQCGACTVLVDGQPSRACITPAVSVAGKTIVTIEGLAEKDRLHPVQDAFLEAGAMQCGYCTPGMVLEAAALLRRNPGATEAEIVNALDGHICRCGAHPRIVEATRKAALAAKGRG